MRRCKVQDFYRKVIVFDVLINVFGALINIYEDAKNIYEGLVNRFLPNEKSGKAGKVYD